MMAAIALFFGGTAFTQPKDCGTEALYQYRLSINTALTNDTALLRQRLNAMVWQRQQDHCMLMP